MKHKIWKYKYQAHKDIKSIDSDYCSQISFGLFSLERHPECETFMDFKTWLTMYKADTKNWWMIDGQVWSFKGPYLLPYYYGDDRQCHFIKFINNREYSKFKRWLRRHEKDHADYQNLKEQTDLATMIRKRATENAQIAYKEMVKAHDDCNSNFRGRTTSIFNARKEELN